MNLKQMLEQRAKLLAEAQALHDGAAKDKRALTEDEQKRFDALEGEMTALDARIKNARRLEALAAAQVTDPTRDGNGAPGTEDRTAPPAPHAEPKDHAALEAQRTLAFRGWLRGSACLETELRACERLGLDPHQANARFDFTPVQERVQTTDVPSGGGFLVPVTAMNAFDRARLAFGGLRRYATVMTTATGGDIEWPGADDTGNQGELLAEASVAGASFQDIAFTRQVWHAHQYSSKALRVSRKLLRDSSIPLESIIMEMLGERIGRIQAAHYATGTGAGMPEGILVGSVLGVTAAAAGSFTADELEDLIASVDPEYRPGGQFLVHDTVRSLIGKMKDGNSMYLFRGANDSAENLVAHGYPVRVDQGLSTAASIAAGIRSVLFGQLSAYKIRDVATVDFRRDESRFVEFNQVVFVAFGESDGKILNSGGDPIKHIVH